MASSPSDIHDARRQVVVERYAVPDEDRQLEALKLLLNKEAAGTSGGGDARKESKHVEREGIIRA